MRTDTRRKLLQLIGKIGKARPIELADRLGISLQALHRHLKKLVAEGLLVRVGAPPVTQYMLIGPDFEAAITWQKGGPLPEATTNYCATRDAMDGRLPKIVQAAKHALTDNDQSLVIAAVGEVANNAFDHNIGHWRDQPGCWMEAQVVGNDLWIFVGDRGQGVKQSLSNTELQPDDQTALQTAFERIISGRAPESRGNGLKFVKKIMTGGAGRGVAAASGNGLVSFGGLGDQARKLISRHFTNVEGTLVVLVWKLQ